MRSFVSIPVPDYVKQHADKVRKNISLAAADLKWVEYENYHLTLKFLGEVTREIMNEVHKGLLLAGESCPPLELTTAQIGFFPNKNRPRVLWLGIEGEMDKAYFLGERVDAYLHSFGFESEERRSFHLTLGRIRSDVKRDELIRRVNAYNKEIEKITFNIEEFHLMESQLSSRGPSYLLHERIILNG